MAETWRIRNITIKNYKAFASIDSENTPLDGKNVLLYGGNGTGKSTLYEALKLLTQSMSQKDDVSSRFKMGAESHLHIYSINKSAENKSAESYITYELFREDIAEYKSCKHTLSRSSQPEWGTKFQKAHLSSDYMTYRVLYDLFKKNEDGNVNIWDVFEAEMLPFINDLHGNPIINDITDLRETIKNLDNSPNDIDIDDPIQKINNRLNAEIVSIINEANKLYKKFFESTGDHRAITFNLDTTKLFRYERSKLINPELIFTVKTQEIDVPNPLSFLNEAALSQIAISIRFAVTQIQLRESPFKLLVIDDLLISLDMDNRDKVINLLMDEDFSSYQMFVFTHDNRFFEGFRDKLQSHQVRWTFLRLTLESGSNGKLQSGKSYEQIVEDYLLGHGPLAVDSKQLAQLLLRKAIENTLETNSTNVTELSEKNFTSATSKVYAAMNTIHKEYAMDLLDKLKKIANTYKIAKYQKDEAAAQNATQELYTLLNNLDDRFENYQILKEIVEALKTKSCRTRKSI